MGLASCFYLAWKYRSSKIKPPSLIERYFCNIQTIVSVPYTVHILQSSWITCRYPQYSEKVIFCPLQNKTEPMRTSSSPWQYFFSKGCLDTLFSSWLPGIFLANLQRCISVPIVVSKAWSHLPRCYDLICIVCSALNKVSQLQPAEGLPELMLHILKRVGFEVGPCK